MTRRRRLSIYAVVLLSFSLLIVVYMTRTQEPRLRGLLVDLENTAADPQRHHELPRAFLEAAASDSRLKNVRITIDYVSFLEPGAVLSAQSDIDFLILSPQSTPWNAYTGESAEKLSHLSHTLKQIVAHRKKTAILGVCGGHQFLAREFGGAVDFIDPAWRGIHPSAYPKEALSERGPVPLRIVQQDPILQGLNSSSFIVMESHYEEVAAVPPGFLNLAESRLSKIQLMRLSDSLVYGTAFHPERKPPGHEPSEGPHSGARIIANFLTMILQDRGLKL